MSLCTCQGDGTLPRRAIRGKAVAVRDVGAVPDGAGECTASEQADAGPWGTGFPGARSLAVLFLALFTKNNTAKPDTARKPAG